MKPNRRSAHITEGVARAPNRSMFYALGYEQADFEKPLVGVANAHSTITPCNAGLQRLADAAVEALEALVGVLYPGILIARLVSLVQGPASPRGDPGPSGPG